MHESITPVNIKKLRMVRVNSNITSGAYLNFRESHTILEFDIDVNNNNNNDSMHTSKLITSCRRSLAIRLLLLKPVISEDIYKNAIIRYY